MRISDWSSDVCSSDLCDGKVPGVLTASQIATGERNGLRLRIYGEKGGIEWDHDAPGNLILRWPDARTEILHSGGPALHPTAQRATRLPSGHPEGFIEAFATLYAGFADAVAGKGDEDRKRTRLNSRP